MSADRHISYVVSFYGSTNLFILLLLTHGGFSDSEGSNYVQSNEERKEDLPKLDAYPETHDVLPELVLEENALFEKRDSSLSVDEKSTEGGETYDAVPTEDAKTESDIKSLENKTVAEGNATAANSTSGSENRTSVKVECLLGYFLDQIPTVQLINGTTLIKLFSVPPITNHSAGECSVVMFYSPYCVFSARAAPHFNALARVFPGVKCYAVDAMTNGNLHLRYGLVAVPNVMLFHKGKPIARFNETHLNLERLVTFVEKYTGLSYNGTLNVTSADMNGPVPSTLSKKVDYVLILAWLFTICCICYGFSKSTLCHKIIETVKRTWQEAEAQHEHED